MGTREPPGRKRLFWWTESNCRVFGRVSMDMIAVDLIDLPDCGSGSTVEFWDREIDVNEVAARARPIAYTLLCNVKRVHQAHRDP